MKDDFERARVKIESEYSAALATGRAQARLDDSLTHLTKGTGEKNTQALLKRYGLNRLRVPVEERGGIARAAEQVAVLSLLYKIARNTLMAISDGMKMEDLNRRSFASSRSLTWCSMQPEPLSHGEFRVGRWRIRLTPWKLILRYQRKTNLPARPTASPFAISSSRQGKAVD